MFTILLLLCQN